MKLGIIYFLSFEREDVFRLRAHGELVQSNFVIVFQIGGSSVEEIGFSLGHSVEQDPWLAIYHNYK